MNFKEKHENELKLERLNVKCRNKNCYGRRLFKPKDKMLICPACGNYIYKNERIRFIEEIKKEMRKRNEILN